MKKDVLTFVLAHGDISVALVQGVQQILGPQENVYTFSNQEETLPVLIEKMQTVINSNKDMAVVCFSDLKGGSCWTLANMVQKNNKNMTIISGVNLAMLVTYFNNLPDMDLPALIEKTVSDGCRGIESQTLEQ